MENEKKRKIFIIILILLGILVLGNLLLLDIKLFKEKEATSEGGFKDSQESIPGQQELSLTEKSATDSCGLICQEFIKEKIKEELAKVTLTAGQSSVSPVVTKITAQATVSQPKVVYVPLITGGSVASVSWTDIIPSEFYFDLSNYPGVKEVRFEVYLLSVNNDQVSARLYDVTNKRGVDYSDLHTINSSFTRLESSKLTIWQGNNKYTLQLRSVNGTGAQLKDARLKIIF